MITFLIAVATVAIAIIITLSVVIGEAANMKERFAQGKEILTILIGVLGTIVGFYFGSSTELQQGQTETSITRNQTPQIALPKISNQQPRKGEKIMITTVVSGGKQPYTYSITFEPKLIPPIDGTSEDGWITQEVSIPGDIPDMTKDTEVVYQISVKDSAGNSTIYNQDGAKKLLLKMQ